MKPRARQFYCGLWTLTWQSSRYDQIKRTVSGTTLQQVWDRYKNDIDFGPRTGQ